MPQHRHEEQTHRWDADEQRVLALAFYLHGLASHKVRNRGKKSAKNTQTALRRSGWFRETEDDYGHWGKAQISWKHQQISDYFGDGDKCVGKWQAKGAHSLPRLKAHLSFEGQFGGKLKDFHRCHHFHLHALLPGNTFHSKLRQPGQNGQSESVGQLIVPFH